MAFPYCRFYPETMKTKQIFLTALILTAVTLSAAAQDGARQSQAETSQTLNVEKAVQLALDNNLSLKRNALELGTKKRTLDRSWNSLLPTLSVSAMVSHPTSVTGDILPKQTVSPDGKPQDRNVWTPGFSMSAGLTLSASVIENIKKAKADYETGILSYEAAQQELELQVRKLFYQMLLLDANCKLAAQNFSSAQARYEQTAALARVGQVPRLDELSAQVDMENLRPAVINAEILCENAYDSFKAILGIPENTVIVLEGELGAGNFSISDTKSNGILAANDGIKTESFETSRLLTSIRSMEAQRNSIRNSAYIPNLRLSWTSAPQYNIQNEYWNDSGSFSISLGMNIDNFFPWSNTRTQIQMLNDNISAAEIQLTETLRNRENRINQNIRTVERILESLEAMNLNVKLAQSTYEMTEDAYKKGAADYQRLRGAGDSLEQANNRLLQEQYNLVSALLDLEKELNIPFGTLF